MFIDKTQHRAIINTITLTTDTWIGHTRHYSVQIHDDNIDVLQS